MWKRLCLAAYKWAPWPWLGWSGKDGDEPVSWWWYNYIPGMKSGPVSRNWLGRVWGDFWWKAYMKSVGL